MYGHVTKCDAQIDLDKIFISDCDKSYPNRDSAARHYVSLGWNFFHHEDLTTSMKRFNQAWMLDSSNAGVYWGFGNILGKQKKYKESIPLFERALALNKKDHLLFEDAAISYFQYFFITKDISYLNSSIDLLKKAIELEANNPHAYRELTVSYYYFAQKDSAKKYLRIIDSLDPSAVPNEVREAIKE